MSKFRLGHRASKSKTVVDEEQPSLALVRAQQAGASHARPDDGMDDEFHAGIRTLYGQLWSCESAAQRPLRSIGVTSCYRGEGKTTVATHLAAIAAESQRVLLIDASASRPLVHRAMQDVARPNVAEPSNAIATTEPTSKPPIVPTVLPPLTTGVQPSIADTGDLLGALAEEFDLLVVDMSPLDAAAALEWAPLLDGIVLVIEAERVRWQVAARGIALLEQAGSNVLGTVINKRRNYIPGWLYRRL